MEPTQQLGDWSYVWNLEENFGYSEPMRLQRDLHVTRVTYTPPPGAGDQIIPVCFSLNGTGTGHALCVLGNHNSFSPSLDMDKLFFRGYTIRFYIDRNDGKFDGNVIFEGRFEPLLADIKLTLQAADLESSVINKMAAIGDVIAGQLKTSADTLADEIKSQVSRELSCRLDSLTETLNNEIKSYISKELAKHVSLIEKKDKDRKTVDELEAKLKESEKQKKALESQLARLKLQAG